MLIIGGGVDGLALADAETFGMKICREVLMSVVLGRKQARLHQNPQKVSSYESLANLDSTRNLELTRNLDTSRRRYNQSRDNLT